MSGALRVVFTASCVWIAVNLAAYAWRAIILRSLPSCDRPSPLPWIHRAFAFLFEMLAAAVALLSLPFDWIRPSNADRSAPIAESQSGVVILIHDFGVGAASFWRLAGRLRRAGWHTIAMRHGALRTDARALGADLRNLVESVAASSPKQIVLLGHGFGGMIARLYGRDYGPLRVHRIFTLGTPHRGSVLSPLHGPMRSVLEPGGRLVNYVAASDPVPQQFDVIALFSTFDALVLPPPNAEYPGAFNIQIDAVGHHALLFSRKVFDLVAENLVAPER
jgi:pimeloyl-ACP methyl ester carboxylesterase